MRASRSWSRGPRGSRLRETTSRSSSGRSSRQAGILRGGQRSTCSLKPTYESLRAIGAASRPHRTLRALRSALPCCRLTPSSWTNTARARAGHLPPPQANQAGEERLNRAQLAHRREAEALNDRIKALGGQVREKHCQAHACAGAGARMRAWRSKAAPPDGIWGCMAAATMMRAHVCTTMQAHTRAAGPTQQLRSAKAPHTHTALPIAPAGLRLPGRVAGAAAAAVRRPRRGSCPASRQGSGRQPAARAHGGAAGGYQRTGPLVCERGRTLTCSSHVETNARACAMYVRSTPAACLCRLSRDRASAPGAVL